MFREGGSVKTFWCDTTGQRMAESKSIILAIGDGERGYRRRGSCLAGGISPIYEGGNLLKLSQVRIASIDHPRFAIDTIAKKAISFPRISISNLRICTFDRQNDYLPLCPSTLPVQTDNWRGQHAGQSHGNKLCRLGPDAAPTVVGQ